jgi:hypothetical protein
VAEGGSGKGWALLRWSPPIVVVAAVAVAAVLLTSDSDDGSAAPEPAVQVDPGEPPSAAKAAGETKPVATKDGKGTAKDGKGKTGKAAGGQDETSVPEVACPPELTPAQCAEFRRVLARGRRNSRVVDFEGGECPFPTQAQCEEAGRAYKEGRHNSHVVDFEGGECPFPTQAQCEEAGRQYQQQRRGG